MSKEQKLLSEVRAALHHIADTLNLPITIGLWDGSAVALGADAELAIFAIKSKGVIAALLKRPSAENIAEQYATGNIAFTGNMIATGKAIRARLKRKDLKRLNKKLLLKLLWRFLFIRSAKAIPQHQFNKDATGTTHLNQNNKEYIQFHYDVGNEFYQLFLDERTQYSCAYFTDWGNSLEQAQTDKLEMICRKLRLKKGERFLDIGCGWGGLIFYAAQTYGVKAHGITLSQEQHDFVQAKIRALKLEGQVTVEIRDYLVLEGEYDKIASVGMFEHVGIANFPAYFRKINSLLAPDGILLNHSIARRAKAGKKKSLANTPEKRMLMKYIFPGGELAPIGDTLNAMEARGFEVHDVEGWREHYALTCDHWYQRLCANKERAIALVGPERYNLWVAYLAGVSLAFTTGASLIFQVVATKRSKYKGSSGLPPTRKDLYRS